MSVDRLKRRLFNVFREVQLPTYLLFYAYFLNLQTTYNVLFILQYFTEWGQLRVYLLIHTFNAPFIWFTTEKNTKCTTQVMFHNDSRQEVKKDIVKNWQLTDTLRSMSFVSVVTDTVVTTRCVLTRRVFRTPAVIFRTLVNICTTSIFKRNF